MKWQSSVNGFPARDEQAALQYGTTPDLSFLDFRLRSSEIETNGSKARLESMQPDLRFDPCCKASGLGLGPREVARSRRGN